MATDDHKPGHLEEDLAQPSREIQDLVLDLNFVPTWARKPVEDNPYSHFEVRDRGRRDDYAPPSGSRPGGGGGDRRRGGRDQRRDRRDGGRRGGSPERPGGDARLEQGPRDRDFRHEQRPPRLPVDVSFIPERARLGAVVRQLHGTNRAFPLMYLASFFLSKPEYHLVKLEIRDRSGAGDIRLFQCKDTKVVFSRLEELQSYAVRTLLGNYFDTEPVQLDAPTGNYVCVGRCRLSGVLLGPPNHHAYNEKLMELYRTRFSHLSMDAYRQQIEMVREPAAIEQWKEESRQQVMYRMKGDAQAPLVKRAEAEAHFLANIWPKSYQAGQRFIMPAEGIRGMEDNDLKQLIHDAWMRENRFPLKLSLALRPAFRRMRLHMFKAGRGETYVTTVAPKPLDPAHAIEPIRQIIQLLEEHPGWTPQQLAAHLCPEKAIDSPEVIQALSPMRWLIEKGHVIEFFNGTLSVPASNRSHATAAAAKVAEVAPAPVEGEATSGTDGT